jgi:hypothetical protein
MDGKTRTNVETHTIMDTSGTWYEMELGQVSYRQLQKALADYIAAARPAGAPKVNGTKRQRTRGAEIDLAVVRQWGRDHGFSDIIKARGRIPNRVVSEYRTAMGLTA